jgi:hypothetical protein
MSPDDDRHGTTRGYHAGCREACCRRAMARYEKEGRLARLRDGKAVPAIGAQRRIQALMRLGWTSHDIAREAGFRHRNHVFRILKGQKGRPCVWLQRETDKTVREVFDRLSMRLPEMTPWRARARALAERNGWPPPLAYEEGRIDDPNYVPVGWGYTEPTRGDLLDDLDENGAGISEAVRVLDVSRDALEKWCARNGRGELYSRLVARENVGQVYRNQHTKGAA